MRSPTLRRGASAVVTVAVFVLLLGLFVRPVQTRDPAPARDAKRDNSAAQSWDMFGGTLQRNMVNTFEKNVPTEWDVEAKKNIKWSAELGSRAYGGPVVHGGKIFVGTNNEGPRNPKIKGDKGIVMCFSEKDGKFLWQAVHDKLPSGMVHDWPREGICSTAYAEGNRIYYVSNRCELVCADAKVPRRQERRRTDEEYKGPTDADIIWLST